MSDVPQVHTGEPLVPISDDEIADRAVLPSWTLTEALFWLGGYRSPGYESTRHMQDHFWDAYIQARLAIRQGVLCQKTVEAGVTIFFDSPAHWLAWADSIGLEHIKVNERMRRALSQKAGATVPTADAQPHATTGGADLGKQENSKRRKTRRPEPQIDAEIKSRIAAVLSAADREWPTPEKLPPTAYRAAGVLVFGQSGKRLFGYSEVTVRKILAGTYSPMSKHGLTGRY